MIKKVLIRLDKILFKSFFVEKRIQSFKKQKLETLQENNKYHIKVYYNNNNEDLFNRLSDKYGTDKGGSKKKFLEWESHSYSDLYFRLFNHCRFSINNIFECGIGTNCVDMQSSMGSEGIPGASLRMWKEIFPHANIIGGDIDKRVLFNEERIKTYYLDQTSEKSIQSFWGKVGIENFDIMIDDGLHTFEAGICLFENSVTKLSSSGIYIIEDVKILELVKFNSYFRDKNFIVDYINLYRPDTPLGDNSVVVIRKPN